MVIARQKMMAEDLLSKLQTKHLFGNICDLNPVLIGTLVTLMMEKAWVTSARGELFIEQLPDIF